MVTLRSILERPLLSKQRHLSDTRPALSKADFIKSAASTDLGRRAADILWDKLSELVIYDNFTPYPGDDLLKVFGLAEEDLDEDVILEIIKATDSKIPDPVMLAQFGPVNTPLDIVKLIENSNAAGSG